MVYPLIQFPRAYRRMAYHRPRLPIPFTPRAPQRSADYSSRPRMRREDRLRRPRPYGFLVRSRLARDTRREGPVRVRAGEMRVVLAVGKVGHEKAEERADEDVLPVV